MKLYYIKHKIQIGIGCKFDFISADGYYGNDCELASKIDDLGCNYMFDIHSNTRGYLEKPQPAVPERTSIKGRIPKLAKPDKESIRVDDYFEGLKHSEWQEISLSNTAKGKLKAKYHFLSVYIWNKTRNTIWPSLLVIKKIATKKGWEVKFSFTNANLKRYTIKEIANMQA